MICTELKNNFTDKKSRTVFLELVVHYATYQTTSLPQIYRRSYNMASLTSCSKVINSMKLVLKIHNCVQIQLDTLPIDDYLDIIKAAMLQELV